MATVTGTILWFRSLTALLIAATFPLVGRSVPSWATDAKRDYAASVFRSEMDRPAKRAAEDMDETVRRALRYRLLGAQRVPIAGLAALPGTELHRQQLERLELPRATDLTRPASFCAQIYGLAFVEQAIESDATLFSSYCHIPHPQLRASELWKFIEFVQLALKLSPELAYMVIENGGVSPSALFARWDRWAAADGFEYADYASSGSIADQFRAAFSRFLDEGDTPSAAEVAAAL